MRRTRSESTEASSFHWENAELSHSHAYLLPTLLAELARVRAELSATQRSARLFELGCGNGSVSNLLAQQGWDVTGVDPSAVGISAARAAFPLLNVHEGSAYDDLAAQYGHFPVVTSLEVVEHVYWPRRYAMGVFSLLEPGGTAIISTPFHGYWKNLALAITGRMEAHFTALWDGGHIKFWSFKTLHALLTEAGFSDIRFERVGRIPPLAKSMIAIARKPA